MPHLVCVDPSFFLELDLKSFISNPERGNQVLSIRIRGRHMLSFSHRLKRFTSFFVGEWAVGPIRFFVDCCEFVFFFLHPGVVPHGFSGLMPLLVGTALPAVPSIWHEIARRIRDLHQ